MIDLGAWADEAYRVPVAENPDPEDPDGARRVEPRRRGSAS